MLQASIARGCAGAVALQRKGKELEGVSPKPHSPLDRALVFGFVCWSLILLCLETEWSRLTSNLRFSEFSLQSATIALCHYVSLLAMFSESLPLVVLWPSPSVPGKVPTDFPEACCTQVPRDWPGLSTPWYLALLFCLWSHVLSHAL